MTLTLKLDLDTFSLDLHAEMQACMSVRLARIVRQTDTQTDNAKTITPSADAGCNCPPLQRSCIGGYCITLYDGILRSQYFCYWQRFNSLIQLMNYDVCTPSGYIFALAK